MECLKKQHYYYYYNTKSDTIQEDAYSKEWLRLHNVPNAEKTHIPINTGTHTPIDIHYNINNVSAGK